MRASHGPMEMQAGRLTLHKWNEASLLLASTCKFRCVCRLIMRVRLAAGMVSGSEQATQDPHTGSSAAGCSDQAMLHFCTQSPAEAGRWLIAYGIAELTVLVPVPLALCVPRVACVAAE